MRSTSPDQLLEALDPEQRAVAQALSGPVRVLAGAGTGKTRAITHRIAYGVATGAFRPTEVLAVTFTARAAGELRTRLRSLGAPGVQARTFHSAALRQARYFWPRVYGGDLPALMESKLPLVGAAARRNRIDTAPATLRDLAAEIEWAKVSNVRPDTYAAVAASRGREVSGVDPAVVGHVFGSYEELKRENDRIDMEDILLCAAALLSEDDRVAAEVRNQYQHFVVDEFQDVSPVQWALLNQWLGGRDELCVVGDPAQTIYSFAGADARFLLDLPRVFDSTTTIELVRNYRSTPQVVEAANRVLAGSPTQAVRLRAQAPDGAEVRYEGFADEVAEAGAVAAAIKRLLADGVPASEVAVLFRINAQSETVEEALAELDIPYVVRGAERFFQRPEVRQAITLLRGAARAGSVDDVPSVLAAMGWSQQPPAGRGAQRDAWESLRVLVDLCAKIVAEDLASDLAGVVAELDRRAEEQHAPIADGVTVATLHTAKGLEWDAVFLVGVHEGTLPIVYAETPESVEEERRLLYVGMTRARRSLQVSWSRARTPGGRGSRGPSRFLDSVPQVASAQAEAPRGERRRRSVKRCRVCGGPISAPAELKLGRHADCEVPYDEQLLESLKAWRLERARSESVPAYVVFTDTTLQALAEQKPGDRASLLSISGIGPSKVEKYGADVLDLLRNS